MTTALRGAAPAVAALVLIAGCGGGRPADVTVVSAAQPLAAVPAVPAAQPLAAASTSTCSDGLGPEASYPPSTTSAYRDLIAKRGYLVVGVSGDTRLLGARNSLKGGAVEGFDIDMARLVAAAIFPAASADPSRIRFKVITGGQRFPYVNNAQGGAATDGTGVDLVARAVTMNCDRWTNADPTKSAAFSAVYFRAQQRLLVRSDAVAGKAAVDVTLKDLGAAKAKVCAPTGSTSLARITAATHPDAAGITPVGVPIHSDCLVLWQEGKVDAITGDDTILAGFKAQDQRAVITAEGLEDEPYGLAVGKTHKDFAAFVNSVLASPAGQAAWKAAFATWLKPALPSSTDQAQPSPSYGRG